MAEEKIDYYAVAIAWGEKYLEDNLESKSCSYKQGEVMNDDRKFVSVCVERLKYNFGREKQATYRRLREFKIFIEKNR